MAGRPKGSCPSFSEARTKALLEYLRKGHFISTSCDAVGIHRDTLNGWLLRGRKGEEPYATFEAKVREAKALAEIDLIGIIDEAATDDWEAAKFKLSYRYRAHWGAKNNKPKADAEVAKNEIAVKVVLSKDDD